MPSCRGREAHLPDIRELVSCCPVCYPVPVVLRDGDILPLGALPKFVSAGLEDYANACTLTWLAAEIRHPTIKLRILATSRRTWHISHRMLTCARVRIIQGRERDVLYP